MCSFLGLLGVESRQGIGKTSVSVGFPALAKGVVYHHPSGHPSKKLPSSINMKTENKTKRVELLTHPTEHTQWQAEAKKRNYKSVGEFIRSAVQYFLAGVTNVVKSTFGNSGKSRDHYRAVALNRIGNNINQIARALNSALSREEPVDIIAVDLKLAQTVILASEIYHLATKLESGEKSLDAEEDLLIIHYLYRNKAKRNEILTIMQEDIQ